MHYYSAVLRHIGNRSYRLLQKYAILRQVNLWQPLSTCYKIRVQRLCDTCLRFISIICNCNRHLKALYDLHFVVVRTSCWSRQPHLKRGCIIWRLDHVGKMSKEKTKKNRVFSLRNILGFITLIR